MILRFSRNDGSTTPAVAEQVELADDGGVTGWRSVAPSVGWFAGTVGASELAELRSAVASLGVVAAGFPPPGHTVETLELPGADPLVVTGAVAGDPLGDLADRARALLDAMVESPRAAVGLEVASGSVARLVHRGSDPLELDLTNVLVRATFWRGYYEPAGGESSTLDGGPVTAGPGWTLDVPAPEPPAGSDITTHLTVDLVIVSGGTPVHVQAQHLPAIAEPSA